MSLGLLGQKLGMTRIFADDGSSIPVTVVAVGGNRVVQVKTNEVDGYTAVQVAFGERRASRVNKAAKGHFAKAGVEAGNVLGEFKINPEDPNQIVSVWASLEHPDLKSKGIFQQFRRLYGANFPVGFSSHVQIENERTREQLFAIRNLLISRKISEDEAKRQILDNYKLQERVDSGFNKIRVEFEKGELVSIVTEKVPDLKSLDFDVNFNL